MANTTWSTTDKVNVTLSGSNLTATASGVGGARAADRQISGLFYYEITLGTIANAATGVGFANAAAALATFGATPTGGLVVYKAGTIWLNNVNTGSTLGARAAADVIAIAINLTTGNAWARVSPAGNWNGSGTANPATGVGGISLASLGVPGAYPLYPAVSLGATSDAVTANFGDTAFSGTVPSGFTSGFTSGATPGVNVVASQLGAEVWEIGTPALRVTQLGAEMFFSMIPALTVTQLGAEVWFPAGIALAPVGIPSVETLGVPLLHPTLLPAGIASTEALGVPTISASRSRFFFRGPF